MLPDVAVPCSTEPSCSLMGPRWLIYPILSIGAYIKAVQGNRREGNAKARRIDSECNIMIDYPSSYIFNFEVY